jgi:hypothetical protein
MIEDIQPIDDDESSLNNIKEEPKLSDYDSESDDIPKRKKRQRLTTTDPNDREKKCRSCKVVFDTPDQCKEHNCTPNRTCDQCGVEYSRMRDLMIHKSSVHSDARNFSCDQCDYKAKTSQVLRNHKRRIHEKELKHLCSLCGKKFFTPHELKYHLKTNHNVFEHPKKTEDSCCSEFLCGTCGKGFDNNANLKRHETSMHVSKSPKLQITNGKQNIPEKKCQRCLSEFQDIFMLNQHVGKCIEVPKNISCNRCDVKWASAQVLECHLFIDHGCKDVVCDICDMIIKSKHYLVTHKEVVHEGVKRYQCDVCPKRCSTKKNLETHVSLVHQRDLLKIKCDMCDFRARTLKDLEKHVNGSHTKAIQYPCTHCNFVCYRPDSLKTHVKVKHENYKPFRCNLCEMAFVAKRDLKKHFEKNHGNQQQQQQHAQHQQDEENNRLVM